MTFSVNRLTSADYVYQNLRNEILSGKYQKNEKLKENDLSKHFETSPTPVREAINRLISEGFLESIPYKGVFVKQYSNREVYEAYWVYNEIYIQYIAWAFKRLDDNQMQGLIASLEDGLKETDDDLHIFSKTQDFFLKLKELVNSTILDGCLKSIYAVINLENCIRHSENIDCDELEFLYAKLVQALIKRDIKRSRAVLNLLTSRVTSNLTEY